MTPEMQGTNLIRTCSIWRALETVGDTPTLLIIEASWLGARRFDDFWRMTALLKALLSDRLKRLVEAGILERRPYSASPLRHEYHLTAKGHDLYPVALMLLRWEVIWRSDGSKIAVQLTHRGCGRPFQPVPVCRHCSAAVAAPDVDWVEGPGLGFMSAHYSRRRQQRGSCNDATSLLDEAAQLMGDRWASLIMRSIFTGIRRFDEIRRDTGVATNILAERLTWLTTHGIIRQHQYGSGPVRYEYRVTRKGVDYYPALLLLLQWGDKYYCSPEGPPVLLTHKTCDHRLDTVVVCSGCRQPVTARDVAFEIVPGAEPATVAAE